MATAWLSRPFPTLKHVTIPPLPDGITMTLVPTPDVSVRVNDTDELLIIEHQFLVHTVGNPCFWDSRTSPLRLTLYQNAKVQTNHSPPHGHWERTGTHTMRITWHWRGLTPLKTQNFSRLSGTDAWQRSDDCEPEWISVLIPESWSNRREPDAGAGLSSLH